MTRWIDDSKSLLKLPRYCKPAADVCRDCNDLMESSHGFGNSECEGRVVVPYRRDSTQLGANVT